MTNCAHDMGLIALIVNGVTHGFSINGQKFVVLTIGLVPALQRTVEMHRVHTYQYITDGRQARNDVALVLVSAAEALSGPFSKAFGPIGDGQVAVHPTQGCAGGNG